MTGSKGESAVGVSNASSSTTRRKNLEEHLWPLENFLSQLKHKPFSQRSVISYGDKRRVNGGGGLVNLVGAGNKEEGDGGGEDAGSKGRFRAKGVRRGAVNFSSWRNASPVA